MKVMTVTQLLSFTVGLRSAHLYRVSVSAVCADPCGISDVGDMQFVWQARTLL
jgi:hypothetical protein